MLPLLREKHIEYVKDLDSKTSKQSYEHWLLEHLRMNGLYWGVTTLIIMKSLDSLPQPEVIDFIRSCWDSKTGGFGAYPKHDAHILSTLSAIQVLAIYDQWEILNERKPQLVEFIKSLQLPNGSFQGDQYGEIDTRFVYTAINSLSILGELSQDVIDPAVEFLHQCENFDGSFGMVPGAESHAAQVFTVLAALAIVKRLDIVNKEKLGSWLSERQVPEGGFNGRPEKLPDVCYSWWVMSSLSILEKTHWIDSDKLQQFILQCQDEENGGFSDRKDNQTDIYHTCFAITGLSLIDHEKYNLLSVDPLYCMPYSVTSKFKTWPYENTSDN